MCGHYVWFTMTTSKTCPVNLMLSPYLCPLQICVCWCTVSSNHGQLCVTVCSVSLPRILPPTLTHQESGLTSISLSHLLPVNTRIWQVTLMIYMKIMPFMMWIIFDTELNIQVNCCDNKTSRNFMIKVNCSSRLLRYVTQETFILFVIVKFHKSDKLQFWVPIYHHWRML